jgi:hypothetical protein
MSRSPIYPPTKLSSIEHTVFSIDVILPSHFGDEIQRYADEDRIPWATEAVHALALYRHSFMTPDDHARENLEDRIRALSENPLTLTSPEVDELRRRGQEEISDRRHAGEIGELILPIELYNFVRSSIESGVASSIGDLFGNALPLLRAERGRSARCSDVMFLPQFC